MPEDPAHVILDANLLLHFKRPDEVNWLAYTHASGVVLLASPILFRELEQQKIFNQLPKLRGKAAICRLSPAALAGSQMPKAMHSAMKPAQQTSSLPTTAERNAVIGRALGVP